MSDIVVGIYQVVGTLFFLSMWAAAAMLLWRTVGVALVDEFKIHFCNKGD